MIWVVSRHRLAYVLLGTALAAVLAAAVLLAPSGEAPTLPEPLESVFPLPGDTVVRQTAVEVDLPVGYGLELYVDGKPVPQTEIGVTPSTGLWVWQPGPGRSIVTWEGGDHTVVAAWDRVAGGRPDPGEYEWTFRVQ